MTVSGDAARGRRRLARTPGLPRPARSRSGAWAAGRSTRSSASRTSCTTLWDSERPDSVLVGWDTLEEPTYRHEALEAYQSGREFEPSILEQLDVLPGFVESFGFAVGKDGGYEADDFLAAAAAAWDGPVLVATSDRDAFQLVSDRVTVLQPVRGVSELARIGPPEVRERYGVDPAQVPDFIALRGDPSDRIPGAPGIGPKKAAELLAQYGSLDALLADGRFSTIADDLRLYRRDRDDGRGRAAAGARPDTARLGPRRRDGDAPRDERSRRPSRRTAAPRARQCLTGRSSARARSPTCTRPGRTPSRSSGSSCCTSASGSSSARPRPRRTSSAAIPSELVERVRTDTRLARRRHDLHRLDLRGGPARGRRGDRGGAPRRLRARAPARPSRRARTADGVLPLRLDRDRRTLGAGRARPRAGRDRRLGRPPRQRHAGHRRRRPVDPLRVAAPVAVLPRHRRPVRAGRDARQPPARRRLRRRRVLRGLGDGRARRRPVRARPAARLGGLRRAHRRSARRHAAERRRLPRARPPRDGTRPARRRRARGRLQPARRCPTWSRPRSKGSQRPNQVR